MKPSVVLCFRNGNVSVHDESGQQVPELQALGWLGAWLEYVESLGHDPTGWIVEMPGCKARVFRVEDNTLPHHFTWEIIG